MKQSKGGGQQDRWGSRGWELALHADVRSQGCLWPSARTSDPFGSLCLK